MILAAGDVSDPTSLLQFGVLGVVIALILAGWLWPKTSVDTLKAERDRANERAREADERADRAVQAAADLTTRLERVERVLSLPTVRPDGTLYDPYGRDRR